MNVHCCINMYNKILLTKKQRVPTRQSLRFWKQITLLGGTHRITKTGCDSDTIFIDRVHALSGKHAPYILFEK